MQVNKINNNSFKSHSVPKIRNVQIDKMPEFCLFCGTFNPIHNAHVGIAEHVLSKYGVNKVLFIPSAIPPHKNATGATMSDRLNMVKLASEDNPNFEVSDIEFKRNEVSYTYNTILELRKIFNKDCFSFLIGSDAFKQIESWYESSKLKELVNFIVFPREEPLNKESFEPLAKNGYNFDFTDKKFCDISSTEVRNRLKNGKSISDLVPSKVEQYIKDNNLYRS